MLSLFFMNTILYFKRGSLKTLKNPCHNVVFMKEIFSELEVNHIYNISLRNDLIFYLRISIIYGDISNIFCN